MQAKDRKPSLSPDEYRTILNEIQLNSIRLKSLNSSAQRKIIRAHAKDFTYRISDEANMSFESDDIMRVNHAYKMRGKIKGDRHVVLKIDATFILTFKTNTEVSDDFFDIYSSTSLPLNTWPFFRELVGNLTNRMDLDPITLPFFRR